ncbi:MAG: hypothetical protein RLZZ196_2054 [Bacteroidota bacterium]|jgi:hypothetical protein
MEKYKHLFAAGCSTLAGGGLETTNLELRKYYKERYNIEWGSESDIIWPKLVADEFNLQFHNFTKSGAGLHRFIRQIYDYIYEDFDRAAETIFFIECPVIWNKVDLYSNEHNRYLLCNIDLVSNPVYEDGETMGSFRDIHLCDDYFYQSKEDREEIEKSLIPTLNPAFKKTYNVRAYEKEILKSLVGLLSFLRYKNYKFYILPSAIHISYVQRFIRDINENMLYLFSDTGKMYGMSDTDFSNWAGDKKMMIKNETDGLFNDTHPGYFAHKIWAEALINKLKNEI